MGKFLEFMSHPHLKPLLLYSARGETLPFVQCFNSLNETECPFYSKFKVCLYDINQRKFVVQVHPTLLDSQSAHSDSEDDNKDKAGDTNKTPLAKEIYLVHYNGFVFGANFSKIIIIREREAKKDDISDESSDSSSSSQESADE